MEFLNKFDIVTLRKAFKEDYMSKEQCVSSFSELYDIVLKLAEIYTDCSKPATTIGGECIRALDNVVNRYYTYAEVVGYNYGVETAANCLGYLVHITSEFSNVADDLISYTNTCPGYVNALDELMTKVMSFLLRNVDLFDTSNTEDSVNEDFWKYIFEDEDDYRVNYYYYEDDYNCRAED